jgi:thiol-disulfide isomerase/thioredoxin
MSNETRSTERGAAAAAEPGPSSGPGPVRSIAHRVRGDRFALPVEGRLAPFAGATRWLNSEPLTPQGLLGRVVLVDFWTYTCINWLRTLPYVRAWAAKYAAAGLTVVGVHTPEFGFEGDIDNVIAQSRELEVEYPVAVDNDYAVWQAFANHVWPALYIADGQGRVRYHHFGEGEYAMTEMVIQELLREAGAEDIDQDLVMVEPRGLEVAADWRALQSPETYLGYGLSNGFVSQNEARPGLAQQFAAPSRLRLNHWDLSGIWTVGQNAPLLDEPGGQVAFQFHARDLNLVMGPASGSGPIRFRVFLDGRAVDGAAGTDVSADGTGTATDQRCYQLIRQRGPISERRFEIEFLDADVEVYCFTFG